MPSLLPVCFLCFCLVLPVASCSWESLPSGTVATVNGQIISLRLLNAVQDLSHFQRAEGLPELSVDTLRKQYGIALSSLVVHSLVTQELRKLGLEVSADLMRAEEARIRADYPGGEFEHALLEGQIDIRTWRELLHNQLALDLFAEKVLSLDAAPSLEETQAYYARHEEEFSHPPHLHLRIISGENQAQAESIRAALLDASDRQIPTGWLEQKIVTSRENLPEEWRKDVEALKPGEISPVRHARFLYQAVQLLEEAPASRMSIVEAYPLIEQAIIEEKVEARYAAWMEQAVQKADIRISAHLRERPSAGGAGDEEK